MGPTPYVSEGVVLLQRSCFPSNVLRVGDETIRFFALGGTLNKWEKEIGTNYALDMMVICLNHLIIHGERKPMAGWACKCEMIYVEE